MIISRSKKFIFLHSRKTAGTYISALLYNFLENDDLILGTLEDIYNLNKFNLKNHLDFLNILNINHTYKSLIKTLYNRKNFGFFINKFYKYKYTKKYINPPHMPYSHVIENFPECKNFFKFCFVRNPYDYAVSDYLWRIKNSKKFKNLSFFDYLNIKLNCLEHTIIAEPKTNWPIYTLKNEVKVDFVGRFENIDEDLKIIFSKLNLDTKYLDVKSKPLKKNLARQDYRAYYTKKERLIVEKLHHKEIEKFKYEF
jgi:hypothetical protein